ncbi:MAG TPA: riboflavin synthase [bacterium]|nr:riboflavin synthase [bacterium]
MFTGLVQELGVVRSAQRRGADLWLVLEAPLTAPKLRLGDSVAVNGCCLTAVEVQPPLLSFQAVPETLSRTLLGELKEGDRVNLELPLTPSQPLGGHFVQGHVDGTAEITAKEPEGQGLRLTLRLPDGLSRYVVEKGSLALDGTSLTVAALKGNDVEIALIPHTVENTVFGRKGPGDRVHVEVDLLAKYVERLAPAAPRP